MAILNMVPKFSDGQTEEVKETIPEVVEEKETPSEPPADIEPAVENRDDTTELMRAKQGLEEELVRLRKDIVDLRGQRRDLKKEEIIRVEQKIDELNDVSPEDVTLIDRVLRAKGYMTKEESHKMFYENVKTEELNKFLEKYPEYKPENDKDDLNWSVLQKELGFYRMPDNPRFIGEVLERAHRAIAKVPSDRAISAKKRQVELAGVGGGGGQRSSSGKSLDPRYRDELSRGGWSEEEIKDIEKNLN